MTIPMTDFDRLEISEATGGPGMLEEYGPLGVLAREMLEHSRLVRGALEHSQP